VLERKYNGIRHTLTYAVAQAELEQEKMKSARLTDETAEKTTIIQRQEAEGLERAKVIFFSFNRSRHTETCPQEAELAQERMKTELSALNADVKDLNEALGGKVMELENQRRLAEAGPGEELMAKCQRLELEVQEFKNVKALRICSIQAIDFTYFSRRTNG
jgi:hypothetical protein